MQERAGSNLLRPKEADFEHWEIPIRNWSAEKYLKKSDDKSHHKTLPLQSLI